MTNKINFEQFLEKTNDMKNSFVVATLTDSYYVARYDDWRKDVSFHTFDTRKVLEVRVFNANREEKIFRMTVQAEKQSSPAEGTFWYRKREDDKFDDECMFDEEQYLDIDTTDKEGKSETEKEYTSVTGTRGGEYRLPIKHTSDAKVEIRYYLTKDHETGQAYVADWRLVRFVEGK